MPKSATINVLSNQLHDWYHFSGTDFICYFIYHKTWAFLQNCVNLFVAIDPDKYPNMYIKERKTFNKLHRTIPMEWQIDSWSDCDVNGFNTFSTQHESKSAKNNRAIESKISATLKCADKVTHLYKETNTITYKYIPAPASKYGIVCMKNEQINQEKKNLHFYIENACLYDEYLPKKPTIFIHFSRSFIQIANQQQTTNQRITFKWLAFAILYCWFHCMTTAHWIY